MPFTIDGLFVGVGNADISIVVPTGDARSSMVTLNLAPNSTVAHVLSFFRRIIPSNTI